MCGGSNTSTQTSSLPPWFEDVAKGALTRADLESQRPMPEYDQGRIADFTDDQQGAFQGVRDAQGAWQDEYGDATELARAGGALSAVDAASPLLGTAMGMSGLQAAAPYLGAGTASTANSPAGGLIQAGAATDSVGAAAPWL